MPKDITINGFAVSVEEDVYDGLYKNLKDNNIEVKEIGSFEGKQNADEFIKESNFYFNLTPPNLIKTSAKLWLACSYTVKEFFLAIGVHAVSHKSLKFLTSFAIGKSSLSTERALSGDIMVRLMNGWTYAEQFHQYSYGSTNFNPKHFDSRKTEMEFFVLNFPKIDESVILREFMTIHNSPGDEIEIKNDTGETNLGKKSFEFKYKVY